MPSVLSLRSQVRAIVKNTQANDQVKELARIVEQLCSALIEVEKTASNAHDEAKKAWVEARRS